MIGVTEAFYRRLVGDDPLAPTNETIAALGEELVERIARYGGKPAVFTGRVPEKAALPYVVTQGESSVEPVLETKDSTEFDIERDIRCYAEDNGDTGPIEEIARLVQALFHEQPIDVEGYVAGAIPSCSGPTAIDEDRVFGRIVTVRLRLEQITEES